MTSLNSTIDSMSVFTNRADLSALRTPKLPRAVSEFLAEVAEVFAGAFGATFAEALDHNKIAAPVSAAIQRDLGLN
jgi:hypothetical protein